MFTAPSSADDHTTVTMYFDNKQFEKNIQQSMNSMDALQQSIDNLHGSSAFDELSRAANNVNLSGVTEALEAIQYRFSAIGVAGMTVIYRLTNALMNFGRNIWNMSLGQMKSGGIARALNIQQAEFMLKGLKLDVQQVKEDAMFAVEDTAFGFDEAAKAAANFGASGIKAGDDMKQALLGVAGVAAMTSSDFSSIADIFSTVASNGKLMTMQLRQFSSRGLNVSAELAKVLNKTEAQINDMVAKGKIDFKTFAKAMNEAFGEHAKDANATFSGALSNVKAALSRIGAEFAQPIVTDFIPALNELKGVINSIKTGLKPVIDLFSTWSKIISTAVTNFLSNLKQSKAFHDIFEGLSNVFKGIIVFIYAIKKAFQEAFPQFESFADAFRVLSLYLIPTEEEFNGLVNIFKIFFAGLKIFTDVVRTTIDVLGAIGGAVYKVISILLGFAAGISDVIDPYIQFIKENNMVFNILGLVASIIYDLINEFVLLKETASGFSISSSPIFGFFASLFTYLGSAIEYILTLISTIKIGDLATISLVVSLAFVAEMIYQAVSKMGIALYSIFYSIFAIFKNTGLVIMSFKNILDQVVNLLKKQSLDAIAVLVLRIAASILILAVSMKVLASIPKEDLVKTLIILGVLAGALVGLSYAFTGIITIMNTMNALAGASGVAFLAVYLTSFGLAMLALSGVLKILSTMSEEELGRGIKTVIIIGSLLVILEGMMNLFSKGIGVLKIASVGTTFLKISLAFIAMSVAISRLSKISPEELKAATITIAVTSGIMILMMTILSAVGKIKFGGFYKFTFALLILAGAISMLAYVFTNTSDVALIEAVDTIAKLGMIILAMEYVQKLIDSNGINSLGFIKLSVALLNMSICLGILALIAHYDPVALNTALDSIALLNVFLAFMMVVTKVLNTGINSSGFIKLSVALLNMSICLGVLSLIAHYDPAALWQAVAALIVLNIVISFMMVVSESLQSGINSAGFLKFAGSLLTMTTCIGVLSLIAHYDPGALWQAVAALIVLNIVISFMMVASESLQTGINSAGFIGFSVSILILAGAVALLTESIGDNFTKLGMALASIIVLMAVIQGMQEMSQNLKSIHSLGFISLATAVLILAGAVAALSLLPNPSTVASSTFCILLLLTVMAIAAKVSMDFSKDAGVGMVFMATSVLILAAAIAALSMLDPAKVLIATVAILALSLALAGLTKIVDLIKTADATGIILVASAMLIMSIALLALSKVPWDQLLIGAGVLALLVVAIASAGVIAQGASFGLIMLSVTLVALGLTLLMIGGAIYLTASAFDTLANALIKASQIGEEEVNRAIANMNTFVTGLGTVCDNITLMSPKFALAFTAIGTAIAAAVGAIVFAVANYATIGMVLFAGYLVANAPQLLDALGQLMDATGTWFEEHGDQVYEFGRQVGKSFTDGLLGALEGIGEAIIDRMLGLDKAEEQWREVGENAGEQMRENMIKSLDMFEAGEYTSDQLIRGLQIGLENGAMTEEEVMRELANRGLEAYQDELGINSPSLEMIRNGEFTIQGVIEGIKNEEYSLEEAMGALAEGGVKAFTNKFNASSLTEGSLDFFGINLGSTEEWEEYGRQNLGGQERWEREGYENLDAYVDAMQNRARGHVYDKIMGDILADLGIDLDALTPKTDDVTKSLDQYKDSAKTAAQQTDNLKDAVQGALDVFSEFNDEATLTGRQVLQTFTTELKGVTKWSTELQALSEKGLNGNFVRDLAEAGPEAYDRIHALYTMTDSELSLFNQMYAQKLMLERSTATDIRNSFVKNGVMTQRAAAQFGKNLVTSAANAVSENGDTLTSSEKKAIEEAKDELERQQIDDEFIAKWAGQISSDKATLAMKDAFTALGYASMDALDKSTSFELIIDKLITFKNAIKEQVVGSLSLFDAVAEQEEITADQMMHNMEDQVKSVGRWATNISILASKGLSEGIIESLRAMGPQGADKVNAFLDMTEEQIKRVNSYYASSDKLSEYVSDKLVTTYSKAGFETSLGLKKALNEGKDDLLFAYQETGEDVSAGFVKGVNPDAAREVMYELGTHSLSSLKDALDSHSPSRETEAIGNDTVDGFIIGIDEFSSMVGDCMTAMATNAIEELKSAFTIGNMSKIAEDCLRGLTYGFDNSIKMVEDAMGGLADKLLTSFKDFLGIHSPSEEFAWCAEMCNLGFANEMNEDDISIVAMQDKARALLEAFKNQMLYSSDGLGEVMNPVIRPVWDMTSFDGGLRTIDDILAGGKQFKVNGVNLGTTNKQSQESMISTAIRELTASNNAIRQEIVKMGADISTLGSRIDGMYVRLDGQALVGQIVNPLDSAMGAKAIRIKRGKG